MVHVVGKFLFSATEPQHKYHNVFSHSTNDCNVFRRQIQSAINDGRLSFAKLAIDVQPFPMNMLEGKKVLIRLEIAE